MKKYRITLVPTHDGLADICDSIVMTIRAENTTHAALLARSTLNTLILTMLTVTNVEELTEG